VVGLPEGGGETEGGGEREGGGEGEEGLRMKRKGQGGKTGRPIRKY